MNTIHERIQACSDRSICRRLVFLVWLFGIPNFAAGQTGNADSSAVRTVVAEFHAALAAGDSARVEAILAADVAISEGGNVETKSHYLSGHFRGDAAYLGAVARDVVSSEIRVISDVATVVSRTHMHGSYRDREIDSSSVETLVLTRQHGKWHISVIHWSSGRWR